MLRIISIEIHQIQAQAAGTDYLERDIWGNCITDYSGDSGNFRKTKDLSKCARKSRGSEFWQIGNFPASGEIINSRVECNGNIESMKIQAQGSKKFVSSEFRS